MTNTLAYSMVYRACRSCGATLYLQRFTARRSWNTEDSFNWTTKLGEFDVYEVEQLPKMLMS